MAELIALTGALGKEPVTKGMHFIAIASAAVRTAMYSQVDA